MGSVTLMGNLGSRCDNVKHFEHHLRGLVAAASKEFLVGMPNNQFQLIAQFE